MNERIEEREMRQRVISESSRTSTTTPDGRPIIAREYNALAPHPAPDQSGRMVPTRGVNKILVDPSEAGTEVEQQVGVDLYECDPCGRTFDNAISTRAHLSSHNPAKNDTDYDVKTMRALVATVLKYKRAGVRNYCEHAAAELNTVGVKRRDGEPWLATTVSGRFREWCDRPDVKRSRSVKAAEVDVSAVSEEKAKPTPKSRRTSPVTPQTNVFAQLIELTDEVGRAVQKIADLVRQVERLPLADDDEVARLRAKAARYDQFASALRDFEEPTR